MAAEGVNTYHPDDAEGLEIIKAGLEQKYIHLLERRIAQLEAVVKHAESKDTVDERKPPASEGATEAGATEERNSCSGDDATKDRDKDSQEDSGNARRVEDIPRVRNVVRKFNAEQGKFEENDSAAITTDDGTSIKKLTTFCKILDPTNNRDLQDEQIEIESPELRRLFRECSRHTYAKQDDVISLTAPFVDFVWYYDDFVAACEYQEADSNLRKEARDDLRQLLTLVRKSSLEPYFKLRESFVASGMIRYEYLYTLYPHGTMVYAKPMSPEFPDWQMFEVCVRDLPESASKNTLGTMDTYRVGCMAFDFDGAKFEKYLYYFYIKKFDGERPVDSLEVFPTRFYRDHDQDYSETQLQADLLARGKKFMELCTADPRDFQNGYKGAAVSFGSGGLARLTSDRSNDDTFSKFSEDEDTITVSATTTQVHGQVVIDNRLYLSSERNKTRPDNPPMGRLPVIPGNAYAWCTCSFCRGSVILHWRGGHATNLKKEGELFSKEEQRLKMCPPKVLGYALQQKLWAQFRIKSLTKTANEKLLDRKSHFRDELQLDDKYKDVLMAFIENHESSSKQRVEHRRNAEPTSFDIIDGKGKGLAILLHGAPGVGKTLTAEAVALATGRPLVVVSVADIGTDAKDAESNLGAIFADAARWGAILLVDEADVFLEAREKTENPNRNALVSVLLRVLEYYQGIIILTTNRIRSFDVAVQSRMHLAIQYDDLTQQAKTNIYTNLLNKIPESRRAKDLKGERLKKKLEPLCRRGRINGRQIRNVVTSAFALANARNNSDDDGDDIMTFDDLEQVHEMTMDFVSILEVDTKDMRRNNESKRP